MLSGFLTSEPGSLLGESNESLLLIPPPFAFTPPEPVFSSTSGSDASDNPKQSMSDLNETSCLGLTQERRQRRKISNRESARRSRVRKQEYLQDLRTQVSRLKVQNRELMNRLRFGLHQTRICCRQNECLRSEGVALSRRLDEMRHVLIERQLQQHYLVNSAAIGDVYGHMPHALLKDSFSYQHNPLINHVI